MIRVGDYIYHRPSGEYGVVTDYLGGKIMLVTDDGVRIMDYEEYFALDDLGGCKDIIDRARKALINEEE